jgi:hypothetical protein
MSGTKLGIGGIEGGCSEGGEKGGGVGTQHSACSVHRSPQSCMSYDGLAC